MFSVFHKYTVEMLDLSTKFLLVQNTFHLLHQLLMKVTTLSNLKEDSIKDFKAAVFL